MQNQVISLLEKGELLIPRSEENNVEKSPKITKNIKILKSYNDENSKKTIKDFVKLYNSRFKILQNFLKNRQELQGTTSIRKVQDTNENETISIIGMISDVSKTRNDNTILTLEDPTGTIKTIITKHNQQLKAIAPNLTPDTVIGITGTKGKGIVFVNTVVLPDVPVTKELKKCPADEAAVFISDVHIGAKAFLKEPFERFIKWISGEIENKEDKDSVRKIKYLFIVGDLVEGIGIFPGQEKDLEIQDVRTQVKEFVKYIKKIPKHIQIIICPGNHDPIRIAEPQPPLTKEYVKELYEMENVSLVSSPSMIRISETESFSGIDVLLYHGYSFPHYASNIESIRMAGGLEKTDEIMTYLIKHRHLAPTHGSTRYQMGYDGDPLVINPVPDFFATGHVHRCSIKNYKNITLLNSSCWVSQTEYQEKRGLMPEPARAIYVDLKTRNSKMLNFEK